MKLWILRPRDSLPENSNPWEPWYDKCFGKVVRAVDEDDARRVAAMGADGGEGGKAWESPLLSTCLELSVDGEREVIIEDVHWA